MEFTEKQLYKAIHRLCHFVPVDSADNLCRAVHDFLVQHAMATHGVVPLQLSEVRDSLKNLFGMDFELKEVESTLKRLHKAKKVVYSKEKYRLDLRKCNGLRQSVKDCEDRERKIIGDWLKSVAAKHPELFNNDLQLNFGNPKNIRSHPIISQIPKYRRLNPTQNRHQPTPRNIPNFALIPRCRGKVPASHRTAAPRFSRF